MVIYSYNYKYSTQLAPSSIAGERLQASFLCTLHQTASRLRRENSLAVSNARATANRGLIETDIPAVAGREDAVAPACASLAVLPGDWGWVPEMAFHHGFRGCPYGGTDDAGSMEPVCRRPVIWRFRRAVGFRSQRKRRY